MRIETYRAYRARLHARARADGDACMTCYFSREEARFDGLDTGMDAGDALIIIKHLVSEYGLDAAGVLSACTSDVLDVAALREETARLRGVLLRAHNEVAYLYNELSELRPGSYTATRTIELLRAALTPTGEAPHA